MNLIEANLKINESKKYTWNDFKNGKLTIGNITFIEDRKTDVHKVMKDNKEIATWFFDSDSDSFWANIKGQGGQKSFNDVPDVVNYFIKK